MQHEPVSVGRVNTIERDEVLADDVVAFLAEHVADMRRTSPPESCHVLDADSLRSPSVGVWVLREHGAVLGTVALQRLEPGHVELKSMRVSSARRGAGLGRRLLVHAIDVARASGATRISLETGTADFFAPARALYAGQGFEECRPFGRYVLDPESVFMTRPL